MPSFRKLTVLLSALLILLGCAGEDVSPEERLASSEAYDSLMHTLPEGASGVDSLFVGYDASMTGSYDTSGAAAWVDSMMGALTLDEKVGQLFIVHMDPREYAGLVDRAIDAVREFQVGGFLVPRLLAPREVFGRVGRLQRASNVPLFIAADYERGAGRFNNAFTELPSNMAIGATRDTLFAAAAGRLTAIESRAIGVNLLFAPVVDVNNNPDNPIINIRSYGEDPEMVGRMAAAFVHEAESNGLLTTLKHFPGHGDTDVDTHARMGVVRGDRAGLERVELRPYRIVLDRRPSAVMSAHLWIEALEDDPLPATFSTGILSGLLREEMGFDGLVVTDDVRMGALSAQYSLEERILRPLEAGADLILTPANLARAVGIVQQAIASGRLSEERLDASVRRILEAKAYAGLHNTPVPDVERLENLLAEPLGSFIAQTIADRAVTLLKAERGLPLRSEDLSVIHLTNYRGAESIEAAMDFFDEALEVDDSRRFDEDPSNRAIERVLQDDADVVVLALYLRLQAGRGEAGLFPRQTTLVRRLLETDTPVVLVTFGNPYAASAFESADAILVAYDQSLQTVVAATRVLKGEQPALGRLPITVPPFPFGSGTDTP